MKLTCLPVLLAVFVCSTITPAAEIIKISAENYAQIVPQGKEVDAIYGDFVLRNDKIVAVIAQPVKDRKANMTVRGVSGMLIDLTRRYFESDQLSCFYPAAGRYLFEDAATYICQVDGKTVDLRKLDQASGKLITLRMVGQPLAADGTQATVEYSFRDQRAWIDYSVSIENTGEAARETTVEDSLRCDGNLFVRTSDDETGMFAIVDQYFGQGYGFLSDAGKLRASTGRNITIAPVDGEKRSLAKGDSLAWSGKVACDQGLPGLRSWAVGLASDAPTYPLQLTLKCPQGPVVHAKVEIRAGEKNLGVLESDAKGMVRTELLSGNYTAVVESLGRETREHPLVIEQSPTNSTLSLPTGSRLIGKIVDGEQRPIAAKVQLIGLDGTSTPDFGPDSAAFAVKNLIYCAAGKFDQPLDAGKYRAIISHGPEYDASTVEFELETGKPYTLQATLKRTVDTRGWVSADFHSHSSPSGDNVSEQLGRVLNLLAEHIEFAPCTEHNRIDTYADDLEFLGVTPAMATCTGMELTGSPLPINHQNAFPLHRHEHEQDGGGPQTDADPVAQIERLGLWDNNASKVVQSNHPNIPQILGDRDMDGMPDEGFRGMLGWMDVIEVHPPQGIFTPPPADVSPKDKYNNPIFFWMQLLNLGYRIPGVVNTDAHYNYHGSGWLRNYLASSHDDPSAIDLDEMIHAAEHGHVIMTTGPFLDAAIEVDGQRYISGEDIDMRGKTATVAIRVQCPNWFDVNRVQVFANGRPVLNFTRKTNPELFRNQGAIRFAFRGELQKFEHDTHLIVATIGEDLKLGPVMGEVSGELPPVAVANPIFLDVDGGGFQANGDDLDVPFMLPK
ncbi:MAG: CehA/McbA family metallohydrolase [Pirellulaceae bacterium]